MTTSMQRVLNATPTRAPDTLVRSVMVPATGSFSIALDYEYH